MATPIFSCSPNETRPPITSSSTNMSQLAHGVRTSPAIKATFCVIYAAMSVGIVSGNVTVASVFWRKRRLRTRTGYFLVGLALADVIVGSVGVPSFIYILAESVEFPSFVYLLWNTIDVFGATASIWHLMMISLERFYAIGWPFLHRKSSSKPYCCLVVVAWCVSVALCALTVAVGSSWWFYPLFVSLVSFVLPLSVIIAVYTRMFFIAVRSVHQNHRQAHGAEKEARIAKAILLVIGCFLVAWGPFFGLNFAYWACRSCVNIKYEVILAFKILQYSSSLCNPVIYAVRLPGFSKAVMEMYGQWFKCRKSSYLDKLEYPLALKNNRNTHCAALVGVRCIDNGSFYRSSWQAFFVERSRSSVHNQRKRNASRAFRKSTNRTLSSNSLVKEKE